MRTTFVLSLLFMTLGGCGSMRTLDSEPQASTSDLHLGKTHCTQLPRIYSGVVYNFCALNGEQGGAEQPTSTMTLPMQGASKGVYWPVVDGVLSAATDTLALPYTIYRQQRDGSIELIHD